MVQTIGDESMTAGEAPRTPGRRVGRFTVLGQLGQGGMGSVLQAYDDTLDRQVAVKLMHESLGNRHEKRMLREAQALARLSHPNVVQVYEVGKVDGRMFIAMEIIHGQTLAQWHETPQPWRECVDVYLQAGRGLVAAHAEGLVHRDFKPSNGIIDDEGRVRVLDFGLARDAGMLDEEDSPDPESSPGSALTRSSRSQVSTPRASTSRRLPPDMASLLGSSPSVLEEDLTRTGAILGTMAYMAPEQVRGRLADATSDQFSFCASLWEALYGERPFHQGGLTAIKMAAQRQPLRPPTGIHTPSWLLRILRRGLSIDPEDRWPSLEALLDKMERRRRPRWPVMVPAGVAMLGVGALGWALLRSEEPPCAATESQLRDAWDPVVQQTLASKFHDTQLEYADRTWSLVEPQLQAYADQWVTLKTDICETRLDDTQSTAPLDRREDCLDFARVALGEAVGVLLEADVEVVTLANQVVTALPVLSRCENDEALRHQPRPATLNKAQEVAAIREELTRVVALGEAGKYVDGLAELAPLMDRADASEYEPLRAESLALRGKLQLDAGRYSAAETDLSLAYALALENGAHDAAIEAASKLVEVVGYEQAQAESMQWLGPTAISLARWRDPGGPLLAEALTVQGMVLSARGLYDQAREHHEQALRLLEQKPGSNPLDRIGPLSNLAAVLKKSGDHERAGTLEAEVTKIIEDNLGSHHPMLAQHLTNLGVVLTARGKLDQARANQERALAIYADLGQLQHPRVAHIRTNLGSTLIKLRRSEEAAEHCQAAIQLWEGTLRGGSQHPWVSRALNCIGSALMQQRRWDEARAPMLRAVEILGAQRTDHPELVMVHVNLGTTEEKRDNSQAAEYHYRAAIEIAERDEDQHIPLVTALNKLGSLVYRERGRDNEAVELHRRALRILSSAEMRDHKREGISEWALGRALVRTEQPAAARKAYQRSLAAYGRLEPQFMDRSPLG
ncbi:MAG: tetratricopeptide repeat protein [Deltaproteobacteria bacterium]|nr:tetratricopeptide repeat protein [Deltaproteobacteria bacterium]